jgi:hypothetical protein
VSLGEALQIEKRMKEKWRASRPALFVADRVEKASP